MINCLIINMNFRIVIFFNFIKILANFNLLIYLDPHFMLAPGLNAS